MSWRSFATTSGQSPAPPSTPKNCSNNSVPVRSHRPACSRGGWAHHRLSRSWLAFTRRRLRHATLGHSQIAPLFGKNLLNNSTKLGHNRFMEPTSLQEAIVYFAEPANCREYLVVRRWPDGVECPRCGGKNVKFSDKFNRWQCGSHHERRQFTLKTGTIFEDSALGLDKWLAAMWMVANCKNGVSSYEIGRDLKITQKSAWFMLHRLREVMQDSKDASKLSGEIEADETFIGGKVTNMHRRSRRNIQSKNDGGQRGTRFKAVYRRVQRL